MIDEHIICAKIGPEQDCSHLISECKIKSSWYKQRFGIDFETHELVNQIFTYKQHLAGTTGKSLFTNDVFAGYYSDKIFRMYLSRFDGTWNHFTVLRQGKAIENKLVTMQEGMNKDKQKLDINQPEFHPTVSTQIQTEVDQTQSQSQSLAMVEQEEVKDQRIDIYANGNKEALILLQDIEILTDPKFDDVYNVKSFLTELARDQEWNIKTNFFSKVTDKTDWSCILTVSKGLGEKQQVLYTGLSARPQKIMAERVAALQVLQQHFTTQTSWKYAVKSLLQPRLEKLIANSIPEMRKPKDGTEEDLQKYRKLNHKRTQDSNRKRVIQEQLKKLNFN